MPVNPIGNEPGASVLDAAEPRPPECLPCRVRRVVKVGCRGGLRMRACPAASPDGPLLPTSLTLPGVSCGCQAVGAAYEPHMFQTRTDDGEYIRPRPLVDVHACLGITGGGSAESLEHCDLWERTISHAGPPWT